jgi:glycosyltransferase involved in cell wall biosynthesis
MKILYTLKYSYPSKGGTESFIDCLSEEMSQKGFDAETYSCSETKTYTNIKILKNKVKIFKQATYFFLKSQPLNILFLSLRNKIRKSNIIHHNYPFPTLELVLLLNRRLLKRSKFIITWHANVKNSRWGFIEKYYDKIISKLLMYCDHIVVTSPALFNNSEILQKFKDKVKVIPLSCKKIFNLEVTQKSYPENRFFKLLFVGKIRDYKGIHVAIESIVGLNVTLTIVGEKMIERDLNEMVESLGLKNSVTFINSVSDAQLIELYKSHDLFLFPSVNEAEAFGIVQIEAMSMGMPVINTNLNSGVPFVSVNELTGLTVTPGSVLEFHNAISIIINDKVLYETFSLNCIKRSKEFSIEAMTNAYLELYK